jgi:hypothetical protein
VEELDWRRQLGHLTGVQAEPAKALRETKRRRVP